MTQIIFYTLLTLLVALNAPAYAQDLLGPKTDYAVGGIPVPVLLAGLDRDGDNDLAVSKVGRDSVSAFFKNGDGTFAS